MRLPLKRLKSRFLAESVDELSGEQGPEAASGADVVASLNALGLFGDGERLVLVRGMGGWKKADVDAVAAYLEAAGRARGARAHWRTALARAIWPKCVRRWATSCASTCRLGLGGARLDYPAWVRRQFERYGLNVDAATARRLVELVGDDATALENEVGKLATWAGNEPVGVSDVERLVAQTHEAEAFALTDSWGERNQSAALGAAFAAVEESGEGAVSPGASRRRAGCEGGAARDGSSMRGVQPATSHRNSVSRTIPLARLPSFSENYTSDELDQVAVRLARLDFDLKGGTPLGGALQLERAILEITRSPSGD